MRACADLAEGARARRDGPAAADAGAAADGLAAWAGQVAGAPFTDHRFVATNPAERACWDAERTRWPGPATPRPGAGREAWEGLGCPHRAGYAWWRQAQAQLDAGQPATTAAAALRAAAAAADGHAPLLAQVRLLAERARIPLHAPAAATPQTSPPVQARAPYGLNSRELAVLRLLAAGRTTRRSAPTVHQPESRWRARQQHPAQARRVRPGPGRRRAERAGLLAVRGLNTTRGESQQPRPTILGDHRSAPPGLSGTMLIGDRVADTNSAGGDPHDRTQRQHHPKGLRGWWRTSATRPATPDLPIGVPPPPCLRRRRALPLLSSGRPLAP